MNVPPEIAAAVISLLVAGAGFAVSEFRNIRRSRQARADQSIQLAQARADAQAAVERARSDSEAAEERRKQDIDNYFFQQTKLVDEMRSQLTEAVKEATAAQTTVGVLMAEKAADKQALAERDRRSGERDEQIKQLTKRLDEAQADLTIKSETQAGVQSRLDQALAERDRYKADSEAAFQTIHKHEERIRNLEERDQQRQIQLEEWQTSEFARKAELQTAQTERDTARQRAEEAVRLMRDKEVQIAILQDQVVALTKEKEDLTSKLLAAGGIPDASPEEVAAARIRQDAQVRADVAESIKRATEGEKAFYANGAAEPPTEERSPSQLAESIIQTAERRAEFKATPDDPEGKKT